MSGAGTTIPPCRTVPLLTVSTIPLGPAAAILRNGILGAVTIMRSALGGGVLSSKLIILVGLWVALVSGTGTAPAPMGAVSLSTVLVRCLLTTLVIN